MRDPSKRCMHCAHYDGYDMKCKAHPPAYAGDTQDFDGDTVPYYSQPVIEYAWHETCGEWQAGQRKERDRTPKMSSGEPMTDHTAGQREPSAPSRGSVANHDAVPAAIAPADSHAPRGAVDRESVGTDKAEPLNRDCGTGNTNARLAALEELSALDQRLELEYGLTGNPMIKAQEHMRSQNCCYCEKPHGKSFPLIFQSCDACQDARDKRATDASNGLVSVSCPRCDLQFSADATHSLTDEEREAIKWAAVVSEGLCQMGAMNRARTLLGILERLG